MRKILLIMISLLVGQGAAALAPADDNNLVVQFRRAISRGDDHELQLLLANPMLPLTTAEHGITALHIATAKGRLDLMEELLDHGANADANTYLRADFAAGLPGYLGHTPLFMAVATGEHGVAPINFLLDVGHADVNRLNANHMTALDEINQQIAALVASGMSQDHPTMSGRREIRDALLAHGALRAVDL